MNDNKTSNESKTDTEQLSGASKADEKLVWEKPEMEDVSEQVMAQPYIRFT